MAIGVAASALALLLSMSSALAHADETDGRVPTEFLVTGDDGLTSGFAQAITDALSNSESFAAPTSNNNAGLVITIPTNIYWQDVRGQTNFQYVVVFTDKSSKYLGISIGACWEKGMAGCASTVVQEAEQAWAAHHGDGA